MSYDECVTCKNMSVACILDGRKACLRCRKHKTRCSLVVRNVDGNRARQRSHNQAQVETYGRSRATLDKPVTKQPMRAPRALLKSLALEIEPNPHQQGCSPSTSVSAGRSHERRRVRSNGNRSKVNAYHYNARCTVHPSPAGPSAATKITKPSFPEPPSFTTDIARRNHFYDGGTDAEHFQGGPGDTGCTGGSKGAPSLGHVWDSSRKTSRPILRCPGRTKDTLPIGCKQP